jgi:hypothetical protein
MRRKGERDKGERAIMRERKKERETKREGEIKASKRK